MGGGADVPVHVPTVMNYGAPTAYSNFETSFTYNAPQAPHMMYTAPSMVTCAAAPQPMTHAAPPASMAPTYTAMSQPTALSVQAAAQLPTAEAQPPMVLPMPTEDQPSMSTAMMGPQNLTVSILQAPGLQHMNHFIGDHPYVTFDVKGVDGHSHTQVETNSVTENDTMNPFWGETLTGNPWNWEQK